MRLTQATSLLEEEQDPPVRTLAQHGFGQWSLRTQDPTMAQDVGVDDDHARPLVLEFIHQTVINRGQPAVQRFKLSQNLVRSSTMTCQARLQQGDDLLVETAVVALSAVPQALMQFIGNILA